MAVFARHSSSVTVLLLCLAKTAIPSSNRVTAGGCCSRCKEALLALCVGKPSEGRKKQHLNLPTKLNAVLQELLQESGLASADVALHT